MDISKYINFEYYGISGYVYSFLCFFVPTILWQILNFHRISGKRNVKKYLICTYIFMFYCYCAVEVFAEMGTFWNFMRYKELKGEIYLIPFVVTELTSHILNIVMFMPLGFLIPYIWSDYRQIKKVAAIGFLMSITIEVCQLFCYRTSDVNDLITNTIGTIVGFAIWKIFNKIITKNEKETLKISNYDPLIYSFLGILGIFMLYIF